MKRSLLYTGLVLLLLPALAGGWLWQRLHADKMVHEVVVEIAHGASTGQIAHQLAQAGVIDDAWLFKLWVRLNGAASAMKAGQYRFNGLLSIGKVVEHIQRGDVLLYRLTVPEGLKTEEILAGCRFLLLGLGLRLCFLFLHHRLRVIFLVSCIFSRESRFKHLGVYHICSGALTPRMANPFFNTCWVAKIKFRRAFLSWVSLIINLCAL